MLFTDNMYVILENFTINSDFSPKLIKFILQRGLVYCEICGEQSGAGQVFMSLLGFLPSQYYFTHKPYL